MTISPTTAYYIRRLLRQNLDQLQPIASKRKGINVDPLGDLNTVITNLYHEPKEINSTIFELERLVTFHKGLSGQESAHDKELVDIEKRLLWLLGFSIKKPRSRGTILVVDDTPENVLPLTKILTAQGYEVSRSMNGPNALKSAQEVSPDLILLDIQMPGIDGYEICQRLKSIPLVQDIPILFVSAGDGIVDKVKAFKVGGADYVTKPLQIEEVLARIHYQFKIRELQRRLDEKNMTVTLESSDRPSTPTTTPDASQQGSSEIDAHQIIHNLPVVIHQYAIDDIWKTLYISDTIQHLVGFPSSRFTQYERCWTELIHPVDREAVKQRINHAIKKRMPYALEFRVVHKNSSVRWVYQQGAVVISPDGSVMHVNSALVDISQSKSGAASL
ncbi:MAG: response regulator [Cyanobacteria bacterium P01_E01_bin.6]